MLFRQLFDRESSTYTYLLADEATGDAVIIDPVREQYERDVELIGDLGLTLRYVLETHVHADHVTSAGLLRARFSAQTVFSKDSGSRCADVPVRDGDVLRFGALQVEARATPGHTAGDVTWVLHAQGMAFTGDALLIRGCGRTDFQQGDASTLFRSVHAKIFALPDATLVYPAHDYTGRTVTTVGEEKRLNPRLGRGKTEPEFTALMAGLHLPMPKRIAEAVPANLVCGLAETPAELLKPSTVVTSAGIPEVEPRFVHDHLGALHLVDVREPTELTGDLGRVLDVENVPLAGVAAAAARWPRDEELVLVCRSGGRSGRAALELMQLGFTRVASMRGGMLLWNELGLPVERPTANAQAV